MSLPYLAKVPAFVLIFGASQWAFVSPSAGPPKDSRDKFGRPDLITRVAGWLPALGAIVRGACFLAEAAAVIAREYPSDLSIRVLSALLKDPSAVDRLAVSPAFVIGAVLLVVGGIVRKICYVTLGKYFTFQLAVFKDHKLITTGPYAIVRHPAYTGFLMAMTGLILVQLFPGSYVWESGMLETPWTALLWGGWAVMLVAVMALTVQRVPKEDAVMRREFGKQWDEWAKRTPYRLIPYVY